MDKLRAFMAGRTGIDQFGIGLIAAALIINIISRFANLYLLTLLSIAVMLYALFRFFSKNSTKRRAENEKFDALWRRIKSGFSGWRDRRAQSGEYRFFTCPGCKNRLRVPRGKGKLQITCPRCGQRFTGKS